MSYDWIKVPISYTQVGNIAVRTYFIACLLGRQYLIPGRPLAANVCTTIFIPLSHFLQHTELDIYVPPFTILEFIFYMGWLQTAHEHLNPMGQDADDFEMNYMLDRNLKVSARLISDICIVIFRSAL
jgi:hypothetical protein